MNQALKIYIAVMVGILVGLSLGDWLELLLTK
jgi:Na+/H+-dicarboxylate symporter